jgi:hypothetical protein
MKEKEYQIIGWAIFGVTLIVAFSWCFNESGLTGWLIATGEKLIQIRMVQISWLITLLVIGLPGYVVKRYFDNLAWNEHLKSYPAPNIHESAKKSKYIKLDAAVATQPARPVELSSLPKEQEEFIATCVHCGHFFSAKKSSIALKCPQCGETIQLDR